MFKTKVICVDKITESSLKRLVRLGYKVLVKGAQK